MKAQVSAKSAEVQQSLRNAELEEANARLRAELAAAHTKVAEVEHCERALSTDYDGLCKDFNDLWTSHAAVVQEKADLEKTERENVQWFWNLLRKKLAELQRDTEESVAAIGGWCEDFPVTNATVSTLFDWFRTEVQALSTAFAECNENISCFTLVGVFKMLAGVECEYLLELKKLALSCDASILHDVPDDIGRIAKKLVRNWWTNHRLPYCM
jgi:chromosome segregation ATPase